MTEQPGRLILDYKRINSRKANVTARWLGDFIHCDTFDPANANSRGRFRKAIVAKLPQVKEVIDAELLRIADSFEKSPATIPTSVPRELNIQHIVRPEQIITAEVSATAVPVVVEVEEKPTPRWKLYLRWSDGRRECRELPDQIDLSTGEKLWIHPLPSVPSITANQGWSSKARYAWLQGSASPDPSALFKRLCERIAYFIDLPPDIAGGTTATLALWTILTYCFRAWDAVPYLYIGGPTGSGKTRVFEILSRLVFRPLQSSNLTGPALFRTLHDRGGTLLFDEAERLRQPTPEVGEINSMLLAGYKHGGQATRLEPIGDTFRSVFFDVFGPKALACIAGLPPALASRCIQMLMFRAGSDSQKPQHRIDEDPLGWQILRDDLHALALEYGRNWLDLRGRIRVCPKGIGGRDSELWQPLLALADWIESCGAVGLLSVMQKHALDSIAAGKEEQVPDSDETLLEILAERIQKGGCPTPGEILLTAQERDPSTFGKPNGTGPRWIPGTVTRRLKTYGIPTPRKSNGERRYRDVTMAMLHRIEKHYGIDLSIPHPPVDATGGLMTDSTGSEMAW